MRITGCVVWYNPKNDCCENIKSYIDVVDKLYIIDNSSEDNSDLVSGLDNSKIKYVFMHGNKGIAKALRVGAEKAIENSSDFLLTMDQDSVFPNVDKTTMRSRLNVPNIDDYGIIGLNFNSNESDGGLREVDYWLTSGNFIVMKNYKMISGFNEDLFIDYVDFDLDEQFNRIGKKIAILPDLSLKHVIGNPKRFNFLGIKFTVMNHAVIRYYYRYRNSLYLYKRNKKFYKKLYRHDMFVDIIKIILFEKHKMKKLKMIRKGRKDAKAGKLGPYEE